MPVDGEGVKETEGSGDVKPPVEKYAAHDECTLLGSLFQDSYIRSAYAAFAPERKSENCLRFRSNLVHFLLSCRRVIISLSTSFPNILQNGEPLSFILSLEGRDRI